MSAKIASPVASSTDGRFTERVSALEVSVTSLHDDMTRTREDIGGLNRKIDILIDRIAASGRFAWGPVLSAGALALTIIGFVGSGYVRDQGRHETSILELQHESLSAAEKRGETKARLESLLLDQRRLEDRIEAVEGRVMSKEPK